MNTRRTPLAFDLRCQRVLAGGGVQIAAIADGETCVRYWNPHLMHGTRDAALRRTDARFPCVHRIIPVDPETSMPVGKPRWTIACRKLDFARYAIDYAQVDLDRTDRNTLTAAEQAAEQHRDMLAALRGARNAIESLRIAIRTADPALNQAACDEGLEALRTIERVIAKATA